MIAYSYDAGQQGALAVLRDATPRPLLLASWALTRPRGTTAAARLAAHQDAVYALLAKALALAGPPALFVVEIPAAGGRSRGGKKALALAQTLADARGLAMYVRGRWPAARVLEVESGVWARLLGLGAGKGWVCAARPEGWERVVAVGRLCLFAAPDVVIGATGDPSPAGLTDAQADRLIARAEAALIGVAGLRIAARGGP